MAGGRIRVVVVVVAVSVVVVVGRRVPAQARRGGAVAGHHVAAAFVPGVERGEAEPQPRRLHLGHAEVLRDRLVDVLLGHAVHAEPPHALQQVGVAGQHRAAVADPAEVLRRVEAQRHRGRPVVTVERPHRLGGVLDHGEVGVGQVRPASVQVHHHHGPRALGACRGDAVGVDRGGDRVDVDEDGHRAECAHRGGRGHGGERRHDHLVARPDPERGHGQLKRAGTRRHGDRAVDAGPRGEVAFERIGLRAEEHGAARQHRLDTAEVRPDELGSVAAQVDDRYHGRSR